MAFEVTPTSGAVPYTFSASFSNIESFIPNYYVLEFVTNMLSGSCPLPSTTGVSITQAVNDLLTTGVYVQSTSSVPSGNCRRFNLIIRDTKTGLVVDQASVTVDNV